MLVNRKGKSYYKSRRQDVASILAALTDATPKQEAKTMVENNSTLSEVSAQLKLPHSSKRVRCLQSLTIICKDCKQEAKRTGCNQTFCESCSDKRSLERKRKWASKHPPTKETTSKATERKFSRLLEHGSSESEKFRLGLNDLFSTHRPIAWHVAISVPFSYKGSKNHACSFSTHGHVFLRAESKAYRESISHAISKAVKDFKVVTAKLWVELIVQKPNHRGDAINILDLVADGIKNGAGLDDRWFCVSRLDWQIVKNNPELLIGIGQDELVDCRVCSYCGRVKPLKLFVASRSGINGYTRCCLECKRGSRSRL